MGLEVLVLGVISGLRPATSQAAVFALLRAPAAARSLLAFSVAGLIASITVGLIVVLAFGGAGSLVGRSTFSGRVRPARRGGLARLRGRHRARRAAARRERERPHARATSALAERLRQPSAATAAARRGRAPTSRA